MHVLGAICGDIVGSRHEFCPTKRTDFELLHAGCRWTDDTVCTVAVAEALMDGTPVADALVEWVHRHYDAGYGIDFLKWASDGPPFAPYGSWGNGSAMRVSAAAWLSRDLADAARLAEITAAPTHDHPHGIRGAKAVAVAVRMALEGRGREEIRATVSRLYGYDLSRHPDDIRERYCFEIACHRSVPEALCCALAASSWEEAVRTAVSLGGDADTQAAIAGAVAEPLFGIPDEVTRFCGRLMTPEMRKVHARFRERVRDASYRLTDPGAVAVDLQPTGNGDPADKAIIARLEAVARSLEGGSAPASAVPVPAAPAPGGLSGVLAALGLRRR